MTITETSRGQETPDTHAHLAPAPNFPGGQASLVAHDLDAVGESDLPQAAAQAISNMEPPAGNTLGPDQRGRDAHCRLVRADHLPGGQRSNGDQRPTAAGAQSDRGQISRDTQDVTAPVASPPVGHRTRDAQANIAGRGPILLDPLLALAADMVDDLEGVRVAAENRLRQLTRDEVDSDGVMRGFALGDREAAPYAAMAEQLAKVEHAAVLELQRRMRKHPLGPWVAARRGIGEKQAARLIAAIGDPYWNTLHDRPRTVSELWAFCGYHVLPVGQPAGDAQRRSADGAKLGSDTGQGPPDTQAPYAGVAAARRRGQRANWSATAKMRAWVVASKCIQFTGAPNKNGDPTPHSPYRDVYDAAREKYADAAHATPCARCGPAGKPAQPGSPLSDGHKHARALRAVAKAVLKDLWLAARDIHEKAPVTTEGTPQETRNDHHH